MASDTEKKAEKAIAPRDNKGRFFTRDCPDLNCGGGRLQYEGGGRWCCDGLVISERAYLELEACTFSHFDGDARRFPHV